MKHKGHRPSEWYAVPRERGLVIAMTENPTHTSWYRLNLILIFILVASVLVIIGGEPASATVPGANGKIAYERDGAIWLMNATGTSQTRLTSTMVLASFHEPAWSPSGKEIAYRLNPSFVSSDDIAAMNANGTGAVNLTSTPGIDESEPTWSPDGSRIAYIRGGAIWVMRADGNSQTQLTHPAILTSHHEPEWSPDGSKIAFRNNPALTKTGNDIYVVNANGSGTVNLTSTLSIHEYEPTWSPDGKRIAYRRDGNIWTMSATGARQTALTTTIFDKEYEPAWSPDGTKITFRLDRAFGDLDDIFAVSMKGAITTNLTRTASVDESNPAWQPLNRNPVAVAESYTTAENTALVVPAPGVLGNDSDPDGDALTVFGPLAVTATNGTLSLALDGSFTYTPNPGFIGSDAFVYRAYDGSTTSNSVSVTIEVVPVPQVGLVNPDTGEWHLDDGSGTVTTFYYGNPGDYPFMGDWDGDGIDTPGLYRQSDGFVYLRNSNSEGVADTTFFFGNPGDVPLAGNFNGCGCDTVAIYRPSEARFYIITELGEDGGGLGAADYSFLFGDAGDKPVVGDWDGDGIDEIGLHRESSGFFYYRDTLTTGIADGQFYFGDPDDRFVSGDWGIPDGMETPGLFRPSNRVFSSRHSLTQGNADYEFTWTGAGSTWLPVAGRFDL